METMETLTAVAERIKNSNKKISLLYAFNSTGKTRLSMEFKNLTTEIIGDDRVKHTIYYNAFTEDLFYWDNDLEYDNNRKLKINTESSFIDLIKSLGKENEIAERFKKITSSKIEPKIDINTGEIIFTLPTGDEEAIENIKISKSEESIFIWTVFFTLVETIVFELNIDEEDERSTDKFNKINYIFIDDPVSSLDENHAIEVAIWLKNIMQSSKSEALKFIITTHHALFYNVLYNELGGHRSNNQKFYILQKFERGYALNEQKDSPFGYHLLIRDEIRNAIIEKRVKKYHFALFRNLLEKTATYLGYTKWGDLIVAQDMSEEDRAGYIRKIHLYSHNRISDFDYKELEPNEINMLEMLYNNFIAEYKWKDLN